MFCFRKWIDVHLMWWPYFVLLSESNFVQHYVHFSDVFYNSCRVFTLCRAAASWHLSCVRRHCASCSVPRRTSAFGALFWQSAAFYQWEVKTKLLEVWKRLLWLNSCFKVKLEIADWMRSPVSSALPPHCEERSLVFSQKFSRFRFGADLWS